ncbi:MAG: hypothetical protein H7A33_05925 [Deltaproteobacteria bacterium]|nr:hypothetical protein [Deltaproteobacteria bacterium]
MRFEPTLPFFFRDTLVDRDCALSPTFRINLDSGVLGVPIFDAYDLSYESRHLVPSNVKDFLTGVKRELSIGTRGKKTDLSDCEMRFGYKKEQLRGGSWVHEALINWGDGFAFSALQYGDWARIIQKATWDRSFEGLVCDGLPPRILHETQLFYHVGLVATDLIRHIPFRYTPLLLSAGILVPRTPSVTLLNYDHAQSMKQPMLRRAMLKRFPPEERKFFEQIEEGSETCSYSTSFSSLDTNLIQRLLKILPKQEVNRFIIRCVLDVLSHYFESLNPKISRDDFIDLMMQFLITNNHLPDLNVVSPEDLFKGPVWSQALVNLYVCKTLMPHLNPLWKGVTLGAVFEDGEFKTILNNRKMVFKETEINLVPRGFLTEVTSLYVAYSMSDEWPSAIGDFVSLENLDESDTEMAM